MIDAAIRLEEAIHAKPHLHFLGTRLHVDIGRPAGNGISEHFLHGGDGPGGFTAEPGAIAPAIHAALFFEEHDRAAGTISSSRGRRCGGGRSQAERCGKIPQELPHWGEVAVKNAVVRHRKLHRRVHRDDQSDDPTDRPDEQHSRAEGEVDQADAQGHENAVPGPPVAVSLPGVPIDPHGRRYPAHHNNQPHESVTQKSGRRQNFVEEHVRGPVPGQLENPPLW